MRLIDADMARDILLHNYRIDAKEYFKRGVDYRTGLAKGIELMEKAPTVDAVPMSVIKNIRADIRQIVDEETEHDETWARGLHYALCIIDKHCGKENE